MWEAAPDSENGRGVGIWRLKRIIPWDFYIGLEVFAKHLP